MDIERFLTENLNEHRKGLLGKTVPVGSMLIWTKVILVFFVAVAKQ
jgi:Rho GTPase-activating protein 39